MGSLKTDEEMGQIGEDSKEAILYVNGVRRVLPDGLAHLTLLEYLRGITITYSKLGFSIFPCLIVSPESLGKEISRRLSGFPESIEEKNLANLVESHEGQMYFEEYIYICFAIPC